MNGNPIPVAVSIDRGGQRRGVVDDQQVPGPQVISEVDEARVADPIGLRDKKFDAVAWDPMSFRRFDGISAGRTLEQRARGGERHHAAPVTAKSLER
jgi:hypothetical protein